jgi:predicted CXXCH cytochrome family protein
MTVLSTHSNRLRLVWAALLLFTLLQFLVVSCTHPLPHQIVPASITDPSYVGNDACKPCHIAEFTSHHLSHHDTTMRAASCAALGPLLPPIGVVPLGGYALERSGDSLSVARKALGSDVPQSQKLDLALGSGKLGMTYISLLNGDSLLETHMSYFPPYKIWDVTPGQEVHVVGDPPFGREYPSVPARLCIGCHATALPERGKGIRPEPRFFGVGCEACHGPGKAHVDAAKAGRSNDLHMENLGKITPSKLNDLCGKCHRTAKNVNLDTDEVSLTHRFQPYALLRSRCRTRSDEPLSCLYCHDPHTDAAKDMKRYEAVCLTCHTSPGTTGNSLVPVRSVNVKKGNVCPVSQSNGCIGCHMRPRIGFPDTSVPLKMADHRITPPNRRL